MNGRRPTCRRLPPSLDDLPPRAASFWSHSVLPIMKRSSFPCGLASVAGRWPALVALVATWLLGAFSPGSAGFGSPGAASAQENAAAEPSLSFNRDIRPILVDNCFACHGPDEKQRKGELRLDLREAAVESGAIAPGDLAASSLVARIASTDPSEQMPPPESNKRLTPEQKQLLERWIAEGAPYEGHWAYLPIRRPETPPGENPIDYLVKKRLDELKLSPAPQADRRTLARRLHFDLLGLPPSPQEVDEFQADADPQAYEALVERLLASPHYGERMALGWLDVVRFADTIGYHSDNPRNVWPYRDYVIRSFNENKPFDRFTIEQLAGDLAGGGQEALVGSAFNHLLLTTEEGGAQAKDYEARMLGDRVRAVGAVWLGQTLGCCQCHDHKFDPSTSRDFYSLGAFFADIREPIIGAREPGMATPSAEQAARLEKLKQERDLAQTRFLEETPQLAAARQQWEAEQKAIAASWTPRNPVSATSEGGVALTVGEDAVVVAPSNSASGGDTYTLSFKAQAPVAALRIDVLADASLPASGPGRAANGNFVLSEVRLKDHSGKPVEIARATASFEQPGFAAAGVFDGKVEKLNGWAVMGGTGKDQAIVLELASPLAAPSAEGGAPAENSAEAELAFTLELVQAYGDNHTIGRLRLSTTALASAQTGEYPSAEILAILQLDPSARSAEQQEKLQDKFRHSTPLLAEQRSQLAAARKAVEDFENSLPKCLVTVAMETPRTVRILPRGNWLDESGEVLQPALPKFLAGAEASGDRRLNRLDLAKWIVSPENPLTARVFVNRLWKQFFGVGISKTLDDLGAQGEWPSHPELLDWLASEFRDSGWDVKHLVRTIVTSQTYRQSSQATPEQLARDPDNRLLARQGRFRLEAELVRDNALAVSGLLSPAIGGPSVKPYQPEGYWENLNFPPRQYAASTGADQYRRGLYTWWQRTFPHPSMIAFDAPSREECAADRPRSNIPQQALVLLNDPTYVEAARALAVRIVKQAPADTPGRIAWAWKQALQRPPTEAELALIGELVDKQRAGFASDAQAAEAFLSVGQAPLPADLDRMELAAWTGVARVIFNLHETVTRN